MSKYAVLILLLLPYYCLATEIINKGICGNNTNDILDRLQKDVLSERPDLVVLMIGTNDFCNERKFISSDKFSANLDSIIFCITVKTPLLLLTILPVNWDSIFTRHNRSKYPENYYDSVYKCNSIIRAKRWSNTFIVDIYDYFIAYPDSLYLIDGVHPSDFANIELANIVYGAIIKNFNLRFINKIICFGDSITRSVKTLHPYSYYLSNLLNE